MVTRGRGILVDDTTFPRLVGFGDPRLPSINIRATPTGTPNHGPGGPRRWKERSRSQVEHAESVQSGPTRKELVRTCQQDTEWKRPPTYQ